MTYREAVADICRAGGIVGKDFDELILTAPPDIEAIMDHQIPAGTENDFKAMTAVFILQDIARRN